MMKILKSEMYLKAFITTLMLVMLSSCVGTIEDTAPEDTNSDEVTGSTFPFNGLVQANAISHDKVELYFRKAPGNPADLIYEIIINNNFDGPLTVNATSLETTPDGLLRYTVRNLSVNALYTFKVRFKDEATGLESNQENSISAHTFSNKTANFDGVASLELPAGIAGQSSIRVEWIPAEILGSQFSPKTTDPVGYEIKIISEAGGTLNLNNSLYSGPDRSVILLPNPINNPPSLSTIRDFTISGLDSDVTYFVQVRAYHKGFVENSGNPTYKREQNSKVLSLKTASSSAEISFNDSSLVVETPPSDDGLSKADLSWEVAAGGFSHYRLYYQKVSDLGDADVINDTLIDNTLHGLAANNSNQGWVRAEADEIFKRISGLDQVAVYQFKMAVCPNESCGATGRVLSNMFPYQVVPDITPFSGITSISNPRSEVIPGINKVHLGFDAPIISSGFITELEVYCYENAQDTSPVKLNVNEAYGNLLDLDGDGLSGAGDNNDYGSPKPTTVASSGKANCDGLSLRTDIPATFNDFGDLQEIDIEGVIANGSNSYCFSAVPVIEISGFTYRDVSNAIIRCAVPEIKTPSILEFTGKSNGCSTTEDSITLNWQAPSGGIYTKFIAFWKEYDPNDLFQFTDAVQAYLNNPDSDNNHNGYYFKDDISKSATSYQITGLEPGKEYSSAVLTTVVYNGSLLFSEFNAQKFSCSIPLPIASFNEWVNVLALGPKENSLVPAWSSDDRYILETLTSNEIDSDSDGNVDYYITDVIPVEVENNNGTPEGAHSGKAGSILFDGIYGSKGALLSNTRHQYSNRGIVNIAWKDVTFNDGADTLSDIIATYEVAPDLDADSDGTPDTVSKGARTIGYRVERSDDGKITWTDLTLSSSSSSKGSTFQNPTNEGLIVAKDTRFRVRGSLEPVTKIASFTDYSAAFVQGTPEVDKGKILYYRITPIFQGKRLLYSNTWQHHVIKVILPPANMSFVHRKMANRSTCLDLGKSLDKSEGGHYSCSYNGLGASSLSIPWKTDESVFDMQGDYLVDRFELGCNYTRGSIDDSEYLGANGTLDPLAPNNVGSEDLETFRGMSTNDTFKGCLNRSLAHEPSQTTNNLVDPNTGEWHKILKGDCFGTDVMTMSRRTTKDCDGSGDQHTFRYNFSFPGASTILNSSCEAGDVLEQEFDYDKHVAQSEFGAVYFNRRFGGMTEDVNPRYLGGNGAGVGGKQAIKLDTQNARAYPTRGHSACSINLPYVKGDDNWSARWFNLTTIFKSNAIKHDDGSTETILDLKDATIGELFNDGQLYGGVDARSPATSFTTSSNRFNNDTPLLRIMTSNASKLPPLDGIADEDLFHLCQQYQVDIGVFDSSGNKLDGPDNPIRKRVMRRKEAVAFGAWPNHLSDAEVQDLEAGIGSSTCNSLERFDSTSYAGFRTSDAEYGASIPATFPRTLGTRSNNYNGLVLFSGSSSLDSPGFGGFDYETEQCVSKYGVQDLVGNVREYLSDQIHCNYTGEQLLLGIEDDAANSVDIGIGSGVYGTRFQQTSFIPWVLSTTDTGECSLVEGNSVDNTGNYRSGSIVNNIYDPNTVSGYDETQIEADAFKTFDQESIIDGRNGGDGSYLTFGQNYLAPPISSPHTLSLKVDTELTGQEPGKLGRYFNPVLGLTLNCGGTTCNDNGDNLLFSHNSLVTQHGLDTSNMVDADFPIGNSQIYSDGMSSFRYETSHGVIPTVNANSHTSYISDIDPGAVQEHIISNTEDYAGTSEATGRATWNVDRNRPMNLFHGGHTSFRDSGRYAAEVTAESLESKRKYTFANGAFGRCIVRFNEE